MKTKNKMLAMLEIAIVLCSLFLVTLPGIAAEQNQEMQKVSASTITTASEDDFVLGVYGNANEDDTIDMRDLTYVKLIFFGKKPEMELADAKYDGKINPLDFIQIKLIIVGKEKELTIIDGNKRAKTFKQPIRRIIASDDGHGEPLVVLGAKDLVVGVGSGLAGHKIRFPELSKLPNVGVKQDIVDIEKVISLRPDLLMSYSKWAVEGLEERVEPHGVLVLRMDFFEPTSIAEDITKLGYLLGKVDRAEEFVDFHEGYLDKIRERVEGISEEDKPRVYLGAFWGYGGSIGMTCTKGIKHDDICTLSGGINIAHDLKPSKGFIKVDPEWVIAQNPDIVLACVGSCGYGVEDTTKMKAVRDEIMNRPEWEHMKAVENENVYILSHDISLSGAQGFVMAGYCAKWFHPGLFEDLDPEASHQEYVDRFLTNIDYDVKKGAFVYPPLED